MSFHWAKQSVPAVVYRKARLSRSSAAGPIRFKHQWQTIRDARANDTPELSVSDSAQFELPLSDPKPPLACRWIFKRAERLDQGQLSITSARCGKCCDLGRVTLSLLVPLAEPVKSVTAACPKGLRPLA